MKAKILADFQICISLPLTAEKKLWKNLHKLLMELWNPAFEATKSISNLGNKIDYISDKNIFLFKQKLFGIHPSSVLQYVQ